MSYPTQPNTQWERHPQAVFLAPRNQKMNRTTDDPGGDGDELPKEEPLEFWHQILICPCYSPTVCLYSVFCCCCAMGDIGCVIHEAGCCYVAYCLGALCPCGIGSAREAVAEKYNLPVSQWEPDDCGWCLARFIGVRLLCVASVCLFPCFHIAQMRAEVAYREHGEAAVFPCCCFMNGNGEVTPSKTADLDYPRNNESIYAKEENNRPSAGADYPRGRGGEVRAPEPERPPADYPRVSTYSYPDTTLETTRAAWDYPRN